MSPQRQLASWAGGRCRNGLGDVGGALPLAQEIAPVYRMVRTGQYLRGDGETWTRAGVAPRASWRVVAIMHC